MASLEAESASTATATQEATDESGGAQPLAAAAAAATGAAAAETTATEAIKAAAAESLALPPKDFVVGTRNRRHTQFDAEFDLDNLAAPERSKFSAPFYFIQAADTQFGMIDSYIRHRAEPGWQEELELSNALVAACNKLEPKPKFVIVCGDLVDAWPGTRLKQRQIVDFKTIFAKLNVPLVCVCGNHDVGNEPTQESVQSYRDDFGDDYFYFTANEVLFIVINSQFYEHRAFVADYARAQDEWLESMLSKCKNFKFALVFEHIPWFLNHPEEDDDYFNIKKAFRLEMLTKFQQAGVTKILCGHYHRNAGGWFNGMELVVTSAIGAQIGNDLSGARVVLIKDSDIEHRYFSVDELVRFHECGRDWLDKGLASS